MSSDSSSRTWDGSTYHRVSGPLEAMGAKVVDRLPLVGGETVLDAGAGTGRVTKLLLDRLGETGKVIALDSDASMVEKAKEFLAGYGDRVEVRKGDLLALDLPDASVDAVLSTATFHWILDHDLLFANLRRVLRPGGRLVAQCGGQGNIATVLGAADAVAAAGPWAAKFEGWMRPSNMASDVDTAARLIVAGFVDVDCWLAPEPVVPDEPEAYLATINLGSHLQRLDDDADRQRFVDLVVERLPKPVTIDYVRLNLDARAPSVGS
ncbi:MAG: trans-aconitate 2-methyltransferase [Actinomycetota bacterium]|jgi:trans-aconitate 2-methyltransferase|nr:trans-aconitate 2-methyltransferase [Actinomycetota bacterium]